MPKIGLADPFYAKITEDANGNETYGVPKRMAKLVQANITLNIDDATDYADDGADVTLREFVSGTISLDVNELSNAVRADLLDAEIDANGVLISSGEDSPKPVAVGYRTRYADGKYRYMWLYRVTFGVPGDQSQTKGATITFQHPTIEGTISRRNRIGSNGKHPWQAAVKSGDPGVSTETINGWFNAVYEPGEAADTTLSALTLASVTLNPTFAAGVLDYTGTTSADTSTITATATDEDAAVAIIINGNSIASGGTATWADGENKVEITVRNGAAYKVYHITVTKS